MGVGVGKIDRGRREKSRCQRCREINHAAGKPTGHFRGILVRIRHFLVFDVALLFDQRSLLSGCNTTAVILQG